MRARIVLVLVLLLDHRAHASDDLADLATSAPACERAHCIEIQLHVAAKDDDLVVSKSWVKDELVEANRQFAPLDVGFVLGDVDGVSVASVPGRTERDAFAKQVKGRRIHVFITGALADIDASGPINGVTWHRNGLTYLIISSRAWNKTLAHELGHFFGLPHSTVAASIMNTTKRDAPPPAERIFQPDELTAMKPVLRRKLRELAVAKKPSA